MRPDLRVDVRARIPSREKEREQASQDDQGSKPTSRAKGMDRRTGPATRISKTEASRAMRPEPPKVREAANPKAATQRKEKGTDSNDGM